jgi:alkylation response protein AidB-like acyl-CoA dehydrogenase
MNLNLSKEERLLRDSVREFLGKKWDRTICADMERDERGYPPGLWREMAELGWMGLIFPDEWGGTGGSFLDLVLMMEEMGRASLTGPFFSTVILGGLTLMEAGDKAHAGELLPKLISGDLLMTMALHEPGNAASSPRSIGLTALRGDDGWVLSGTKLFVPYAHVADYLICVGRTEGEPGDRGGIGLFLVPGGDQNMEKIPLDTMGRDRQYEVRFADVHVAGDAIVGGPENGRRDLDRVLRKAAVCKCAEMVGAGQRILETATEYAKKRVQFGRPIGSFQAVQHHLVNMLIDIDACRWMTYRSAWMTDRAMPCEMQTSVTKAWCNEAYRRVVALGHQVFGGVGYCEDHDMPGYFRRARASETAFGCTDYHLGLVADLLFQGTPEAPGKRG